MRALPAVIFAMLVAAGAADAQSSYRAPRTADGHPEIQGMWSTRFITQLERPPGVPGPTVTREQAPAAAQQLLSGAPEVIDPDFHFYNLADLAEVRGALRTSLIVEPAGGLLPFTEAGTASANEYDRRFTVGFDNPEERDNSERCLAGMTQAPIRPIPAPFPFQFVQTRDYVVISTEDTVATRIIHLDEPPPPDAMRSREGWSAGRWEGDTLVVVTDHLRGDDPWRITMGRSLVVGAYSRVIERFTRVSDGELHYEFTVEDPSFYATPWRAEFSFARTDGERVYEYACHEANYSMTNMLKGGREAQRRAQMARR
jgi:hypothetical protein